MPEITYLEIPKLTEPFLAVIETTEEWLFPFVNNLVSADITTLRKCFATDITRVWLLSIVSSLMGLSNYQSVYCSVYRVIEICTRRTTCLEIS